MCRAMIWAVAAVLGLTALFPAGVAAQALRPTDADLYCAGYITQRTIGPGMTVLGGEDGGLKNEFVDRDIIYLTQGQGVAPGTQFMVVRPIYDTNPRDPIRVRGTW